MSERGRTRGSFFNSFVELKRTSKSFHTIPVPRVKVSAIIQKNSEKYFDPSLAKSMDGLLEDSYNIVLNRKNQKKEYMAEEEELTSQIKALEMDILPEMNRFVSLKDAVRAAKEQQDAFKEGLRHYEHEIEKQNEAIVNRKRAIQNAGERYLETIKEIDNEIHEIKTDTYQSRDRHSKEIEVAKAEIQEQSNLKAKLKEEFTALKGEHEKISANQGDKIRKIENKTRMFLGLLKH